jgi:hypothetical protein
MLLLSGLLLFVVAFLVLFLFPVLWGREIYHRYEGARPVTCPENHQHVAVSLDAIHAAVTGLAGPSDLRLADCTRWPERWKCDRACLSEVLQAQPYRLGEVKITSKRIYHIPVMLAAFAAWYIGAVWHSQYLFRARWMDDLGLTPAQLREIVRWYSPHLLSALACLLFAYGVAWLLAVRDRRGVVQGILTSMMFWCALLVVTGASMGNMSSDLLFLEFGYTLIASIVVGAVIGGLEGKLALSTEIGNAPVASRANAK